MRTKLMREPAPSSGLAETARSGCSASGDWEAKLHSETNRVWRVPPVSPSPAAKDSPASSASGAENVWSPKVPLVSSLEIRRLWPPKAGGAPALVWTATSNGPVFFQPFWPFTSPALKVGASKVVEIESADAAPAPRPMQAAAMASPRPYLLLLIGVSPLIDAASEPLEIFESEGPTPARHDRRPT